MNTNTFKGVNGLKAFLNPENHTTPLIELPKSLNPFLNDNIHIFIKLQTMTPLMNVKSIPAYEMLKTAPKDKKYLVEASSGNTATSLAIIGKSFGFEKTRTIVSHDMAAGKLKSLLLFGSEVEIMVEPEDCKQTKNGGIIKAKQKGGEPDWYNPNQYAHPANPESHEKITGPQIYEQLDGKIDVFASGLGTSGTVLGTGRYLKKQNRKTKIIGIVRKGTENVPGPRTREFLKAVEFDWENICDDIIPVNAKTAYENSLKLCQSGLLVGPSTGLNYAGLLKYLEKAPKGKRLNAVMIACDTPFPYLDDYFRILPKEAFPEIIGENLLVKKVFEKTNKIC